MSQLSFAERVVVVTGAGNGLGRSYALDLAKRGAKVVVNDLGGAVDGTGQGRAAQDVVNEITALGGTAVPNFDSVATRQGGNAIIKTALDTWGRVAAVIGEGAVVAGDRLNAEGVQANWDAIRDVSHWKELPNALAISAIMKDKLGVG
jgi:NAD(P)-dependent dehydrogenase (short-subunit alcohol dehydrogenase family)